MKKIRNIILLVLGGLLVAGTSGCLPQDTDLTLGSEAEIAKLTLMSSLENTVVGVADRVDQSIIKGATVAKLKEMIADFELSEFHPTLNEFRKTLNYILGSPTLLAPGVVEYRADPRLCSEVLAVNDPASCVSVMRGFRLIQKTGIGNTGNVSVYFAEIEALQFTYSENKVSLAVNAQKLLAAIVAIDRRISEELGREVGVFPSEAQGTLEITVMRESMGGASFSVALPEGLILQGSDEGHPYILTLDAAEEFASVMLNSMGAIDLTLNTSGGSALFDVKNNQNVWIPLSLNIPRLVGNVLFSDLERLVKFTAFGFQNRTGVQDSAELKLSSSATKLLSIYAPLNSAKMFVTDEQTFNLKTLQAFNFVLEWFSDFDVFGDEGAIRVTASNGFDADLSVTSPNVFAKVNSGSLQIDGDGVLEGSMDASAGQCFELGNPEGASDTFPFDLTSCL
jgi:hypothetical protein